MGKLVLLVSLLVIGLIMISPVLGAYEDGCSCHKSMDPIRDESAYLKSVHGEKGISCSKCHIGFDEQPHPELSVNCDNVECHSKGYTLASNWVVANHDVIISEGAGESSEEESAAGEEQPGTTDGHGTDGGMDGGEFSSEEPEGEVSEEPESSEEVTGESSEETTEGEPEETEEPEKTEEDEETPGFGIAIAILGIIAVAFLTRRR